MQHIHHLRPPGRFLIEVKSEDHCISSSNSTTQYDDTVHPLINSKAWVQVANDKVMVKIMHRLRDKDDEDKIGGSKNEEMDPCSSPNNINDMNDNLVKLMKDIWND